MDSADRHTILSVLVESFVILDSGLECAVWIETAEP